MYLQFTSVIFSSRCGLFIISSKNCFFHVPARTVTSESCCFSCMMAFSFSSKVSWVVVVPNDPCRSSTSWSCFFGAKIKQPTGLFVALGVEFYFKSIWNSFKKRTSQIHLKKCEPIPGNLLFHKALKTSHLTIPALQMSLWTKTVFFCPMRCARSVASVCCFLFVQKGKQGTHGWWILAVSWVFRVRFLKRNIGI